MSITHGPKEALNKRNKKKYELGSEPTETKVSVKDKRKKEKRRGGNTKTRLTQASKVNLLDKEEGEYTVTEIDGVKENPANRNYARENVVTKGTVIETPEGEARVTSRPGQDGVVNAVLIQEK